MSIIDWIQRQLPPVLFRTEVLLAIGIGSFLFAMISLFLVGWLLVRIPADYFVSKDTDKTKTYTWRFILLAIIKNIAGTILIMLGILLSLPGVPGQGILTILIGITLMSFRGKRRMQLWILRRRGVVSTINRLRHRSGRQPLILPEPAQSSSAS